jgi:hypothetical protein
MLNVDKDKSLQIKEISVVPISEPNIKIYSKPIPQDLNYKVLVCCKQNHIFANNLTNTRHEICEHCSEGNA